MPISKNCLLALWKWHKRLNCVFSIQRFAFHGQGASLPSLPCLARLHSLFLEVWLKVKCVLAAASAEFKPGWRLRLKYKLDGCGLSRAEILRTSHDAMGQNCATWLISRSCLSKMILSSSFLRISSQPTEYYRRKRIVLCWFCSGLIKKTWEKGFRRACLSGKFVSLHLLVFNEIEDYRKVLQYYFWCKWPFLVILRCLVCHGY